MGLPARFPRPHHTGEGQPPCWRALAGHSPWIRPLVPKFQKRRLRPRAQELLAAAEPPTGQGTESELPGSEPHLSDGIIVSPAWVRPPEGMG